jgi:hypothetical protein
MNRAFSIIVEAWISVQRTASAAIKKRRAYAALRAGIASAATPAKTINGVITARMGLSNVLRESAGLSEHDGATPWE